MSMKKDLASIEVSTAYSALNKPPKIEINL
jgi:hypothetical protein